MEEGLKRNEEKWLVGWLVGWLVFYVLVFCGISTLNAKIFLYISNIQSASKDSGCGLFAYPVSSQSYCMYVRAGRSAIARPYVEVHRSTPLMSPFLLLQQCLACLIRLTWIVFVIGGRWPYSWCFVGCCLQDLFNIVRSILV